MSAVRPSKSSGKWFWAQRLSLLALAGALVVMPGCKNKTGPSPHYDRGAGLHQQLWVRLLDDAYLDPRMDEAVRELKLVETTSVSYPNAVELLAQIEKGRKDAAAARDARAAALAEMEKGVKAPAISGVPTPGAPPPPPPPPPPPDAGPAVPDPFGPGALIADINKSTGGCLVASVPFREEGEGGKAGVSYKLAPGEACKDKLPGFVGQVVLAVDGKVYRRIPAAETRIEEPKKGAADAGTAAPAKAEAAPAKAPEAPQAYEGQKDAPKPVETAPGKVEETKGVKLPETPAGKVEDSTPRPAK
jgi:hypothetical protein